MGDRANERDIVNGREREGGEREREIEENGDCVSLKDF